jgi:type I restriction enzyme R subunit
LIQAFSRTNRILNDTKPYGNILDFRRQQNEVDTAIALFSGEDIDNPKQIWLVDPAPTVIKKFEKAVSDLSKFMNSHGLECKAEEVNNLRGDDARAEFINYFKKVQRLKTQLVQYTDIDEENNAKIDALLPEDQLHAFRGVYLDTAQQLKKKQEKPDGTASLKVVQLDFEFVLFASAVIDYDYIMGLIAKYAGCEPSKVKVTKEQLINLVSSSANLMDERDDIVAYIDSLDKDEVNGKTEKEIREGYQTFKSEKLVKELAATTSKYGLETSALQTFVNDIMSRMIFDGEKLTDLMEPLELSWRERRVKELALMEDLLPVLKRLAAGREISGLSAYEE